MKKIAGGINTEKELCGMPPDKMQKVKMQNITGKVARLGVLAALAMVFSYIESLFPLHIGIPGIKAGLANIVVVTALYLFGAREAFFLSLVRILLMGFWFGNGMSLAYSLAGGMLSLIGMICLKHRKRYSIIGVSAAGGALHNVGQIAVAALVVQNVSILFYLAALLIAGVITGGVIGLFCSRIIPSMRKVAATGTL